MDEFDLTALGEYIIIKPMADPTMTRGGLHLPRDTQQTMVPVQCGDVLSAGTKVEVIKQGDVVFFARQAGLDFEYKGDVYKILREVDIPAAVNKQEPEYEVKTTTQGFKE